MKRLTKSIWDEVLTAQAMQVTDFYDVIPCSLAYRYSRGGGMCKLYRSQKVCENLPYYTSLEEVTILFMGRIFFVFIRECV
jgi:hypothetical protein